MVLRQAKAADGNRRYRAPALDKGLDIIELLSEQPTGLTRAEIVKAMGRGPSEIYRMLERLVARDYVSRSPEGDRYALSMKLFVLAHRHPPLRRLVSRALPLMDAFARDARQSCHLVAPDRDGATVVAQASCPGNWEFGIRIGARIDLLKTGSGMILLAFQDPASRIEMLARFNGGGEIEAAQHLEPMLQSHRKVGFRVGESRQIAGVRDISVPVLSPDGRAIAALTCPFIQSLGETADADIGRAVELLKTTGEKLSLT